MLDQGSLAVALVQRQVMIVQAARSHSSRDRWMDVNTFRFFGERLFLETDVPKSRIASSDILSIFPASDVFSIPADGMLELPPQAFLEFTELNERNQLRHDKLWRAWAAAL